MRHTAAIPFVLLLSLLAGCPRQRVVEPPPSRAPEVRAPQLEGAQLYQVDPAASRVDVLVYRGGPMARLGHNHVMSVQELSGRVWVHPQALARSGFELKFPVEAMVVDAREARLAAGDEFPPDIPDKDKAGTRANMLRTEVLDAATYPLVQLHAFDVAVESPDTSMTVAVTLKGVTRELRVPATVAVSDTRVQAQGEFSLRQTEFGITPFSVAMGAVQVVDELKIRFNVIATREQPVTSP